jgi:hypothetical protein
VKKPERVSFVEGVVPRTVGMFAKTLVFNMVGDGKFVLMKKECLGMSEVK